MAFQGKWITLPEYADTAPIEVWHRQLETRKLEPKMEPNLHVLFRDRFRLDKTEGTTIRITADDYYKLYINGRFVTQGPAPAFHFKYYFNTIDISDFVQPGENTIAVHTYYQGLINRVWCSGDDRHGLIYDILQGDTVLSCSTEGMKCARHTGYTSKGITGYSTQYLERYDCLAPEIGFEKPDFDDSGWQNAALRHHMDYTFVPQPTRQLVFEKIFPAAVERTTDGLIVDFGSQYVGYPIFKATGKTGDSVIIRCGQELLEDGSVRYKLRANCVYEEEIVLSGKEDSLNPFDYKTCRYMQLIVPQDCCITDIHFLARHYPLDLQCACAYSDPDLVKIWNLCVHSLRWGVQEVIQDCMDREKGQYLGDGSYSTLSHAILTGETALMEKMIDNALDTSFISPTLMTCSPCSFMQEIAEYVPMMAVLLLAHTKISGSTVFAAAQYDRVAAAITAYRDAYEREDHLLWDLDRWCVVDWPHEARDGYDFDLTEGRIAVGTHSVINAYYLLAVRALNKLAAMLGREPYRDAAVLEQAFMEHFYLPEKKLFRDTPFTDHTALGSNAMALAAGVCPEDALENVIGLILSKEPHQSAFFMTFAALVGLKRYGRDDLICQMIKSEGRWLRMLQEDATTTFEAWGKDQKWNTSLFHLCYTFAVIFLADWGMEELF